MAALAWLSDMVYCHADKVVVLGPYMADRIAAKGVRRDRLVTIPVWSRRDEIYPLPPERNPLRKSLGLEGSFVAMYSGNLGLAHSFDEFLDAARALRDRRDIVFLFVGDGPRKRGATVPLPVYNRNQGNIQRARINVSQVRTELAAQEQRVVAEVQKATREYA